MNSTDKAQDKKTLAKTPLTAISKKEETKLVNVKPFPLPQNRPIADNISEGIAELMGYLD